MVNVDLYSASSCTHLWWTH